MVCDMTVRTVCKLEAELTLLLGMHNKNGQITGEMYHDGRVVPLQ